MKIAKIDRICPISGNTEYSLLDESAYSCGRRQVECNVLRNVLPDEVGDRICKKDHASLVSEGEFSEFLSLFQEEDDERIARRESENEKREEEKFYASLTGIRLKIYNELGLEGTEWKEAAIAIDDEFRARHRSAESQSGGYSPNYNNGYIWNPGR